MWSTTGGDAGGPDLTEGVSFDRFRQQFQRRPSLRGVATSTSISGSEEATLIPLGSCAALGSTAPTVRERAAWLICRLATTSTAEGDGETSVAGNRSLVLQEPLPRRRSARKKVSQVTRIWPRIAVFFALGVALVLGTLVLATPRSGPDSLNVRSGSSSSMVDVALYGMLGVAALRRSPLAGLSVPAVIFAQRIRSAEASEAFKIDSDGGKYVKIGDSSNKNCITTITDNNGYANNAYAKIFVGVAGILYAKVFQTEQCTLPELCDYVAIGGINYGGSAFFPMAVNVDETIEWRSDQHIQRKGFTLCICSPPLYLDVSSSGDWSPTCREVQCPTLLQPTNGSMIEYSANQKVGSNATFSCITRYALSSAAVLTCSRTTKAAEFGTWLARPTCSLAQCLAPSAPTNGTVTFSDSLNDGSIATYSCAAIYTLSGAATQTCAQNSPGAATGSWTGSAPMCTPAQCPALSPPTNGAVSFSNSLNVGSIATYSCAASSARDVYISNAATQTCEQGSAGAAAGSWSGSASTCATLVEGCPDLATALEVGGVAIVSGKSLVDASRQAPNGIGLSRFGDQLVLKCGDGQTPDSGPSVVTCSFQGVWEPDPLSAPTTQCNAQFCEDAMLPPASNVRARTP